MTGQMETSKYLSRNSQPLFQDLRPGPPEHEAQLQPLQQLSMKMTVM
jgi:hypothetical protein